MHRGPQNQGWGEHSSLLIKGLYWVYNIDNLLKVDLVVFSVCLNMVNKQSVGKFPVYPVCFHTLKPFNWELLILTMPTCCLLLPWLPPKYSEPFRSSGWGSPHPAAKSLQSCPTLCDPVDGSPLGSPVPGILQARILEWVAISFSNA